MSLVKLPNGCGKSYVAFLLALCFAHEGKSFAVVTSDRYLVDQLQIFLGDGMPSITIVGVEEAYLRCDEFDGFVIDEADRCILEKGCTLNRATD